MLRPLLCFIIVGWTLSVIVRWGLENLLFVYHVLEVLLRWVQFVLLLNYIPLVDVGSFEPWGLYWRWWSLLPIDTQLLRTLVTFTIFLLLLIGKDLPQASTVVCQSFSITKFHLQILRHLLLCDSYQVLSLYLVLVKNLLVLWQVYYLEELTYFLVIPLLYMFFYKRELDYLTYSIVLCQELHLKLFYLWVLFLEIV